jgi:hypothetical protein
MHARAEQSSETVKIVEKGLKMRVTGRDKNWVQVSDPASSLSGWIYSPFLMLLLPGPLLLGVERPSYFDLSGDP